MSPQSVASAQLGSTLEGTFEGITFCNVTLGNWSNLEQKCLDHTLPGPVQQSPSSSIMAADLTWHLARSILTAYSGCAGR